MRRQGLEPRTRGLRVLCSDRLTFRRPQPGPDAPGWPLASAADDQHEPQSFAAGIRHDLAAVTTGLTLRYSSGSTQGNVNQLKAIKRQMYGRASLDLRKRVILHPR